ncbi:sulfatase-like hydrolase/transferase [Cohnella sp.]|uniref:sulfatase-like hydrolase/transferase n=1 Tax=Cohnella sp. TaxID=1883426 RepID=UPI00356396CE
MSKPDILVFLSDQHHANYAGYMGHGLVRTPHLDRLAADGTAMNNAYTAAPQCVPARASMLTGRLPEKTGIYTNDGAIGSAQTTFLHSLAAEGYETVLCGRMHFLGEDQRHGFTKRIMGEMTPLFWGRYGKARSDLGPYAGTMANRSLKIVGGGDSPVLAYDRAVVRAALDYLSRDHEKPQCIVVGTYGPHHTFVAPPDSYSYYKKRVDIPASFRADSANPILAQLRQDGLHEETLLKVRAAYFGMIETIDGQLGQVREAWEGYLRRRERQGAFVYLSDHGEQAGEHGLIGKRTFYEGSVKIPMIFAGDGVTAGRTLSQPVSMLDVGPTLCDLAGAAAPPPRCEGRSLRPQLSGGEEDRERMVVSETIFRYEGRLIPARMLRQGRWKYVAYAYHEEHNQLFDLQADPSELRNVRSEERPVEQAFLEHLRSTWDIEAIVEKQEELAEHYALLGRWGSAVDVPEPERWAVPPEATKLPVIE